MPAVVASSGAYCMSIFFYNELVEKEVIVNS